MGTGCVMRVGWGWGGYGLCNEGWVGVGWVWVV